MVKVNYFDLGLANDTRMLDGMIDVCNQNNIQITVYAFEATKSFYEINEDKYKNNNNVKIYHTAVSDVHEQSVKIYRWGNEYGNTIYENYVAKAGHPDPNIYEIVQTITLSKFIEENKIGNDGSINIIKMNIEGSEYNVMKNLKETNMLEFFDLYMSIKWFNDVNKIGKGREFNDMIKKGSINHTSYYNMKQAFVEIKKLLNIAT